MHYTREQAHRIMDDLYDSLDQAWKPPQRRPLATLRHDRQQDVAECMGITQPAVSQLEKRRSIDEKTLRSYVEACGAKLETVARCPDGQLVPLDVEILD